MSGLLAPQVVVLRDWPYEKGAGATIGAVIDEGTGRLDFFESPPLAIHEAGHYRACYWASSNVLMIDTEVSIERAEGIARGCLKLALEGSYQGQPS